MRVIIPVINETIAAGFNQTPDVCVFDTESNSSNRMPWREIIPPGTKITSRLKAAGITAVLVYQIQLLALNLFRDNGIQVYKSRGDDLYCNLKLITEGDLQLYSVENALENNQLCGGSCNECSSTTSSCKV